MNKPSIRLTTALCAAALAFNAQATTYYWKGATGDSAYGDWSDLSNWSTESANGADAAALPGANDTFYGLQARSIDLEGQERSIGGWDSTGNWTSYEMNLRNGTLNVVGNVTTHSDVIGIREGAKLVFASGQTFLPAVWDGGKHCQYVHSGGEVDILGNFSIYNYGLTVFGGGTAIIAPTRVDISNNNAQKSFFQNDGGKLSLPNGLVFQSGSTDGGFKFSINQNSGTLELGGPISKNGKAGTYEITLSGGTVVVIGNASFDFTSATVPADANLTLQIASGASIDLSSLTFGSGATITKTGAGDFTFVNGMGLPDTFVLSEGSLALSSAGSYDISGVTFSGGTVKIGVAGVTLTAWDSSLLSNGGFVSGIAAPVVGSTLLTCANDSVLALAKAGLDASLPDGFAVTKSGNDLVVSSAYVFDSTTVTDLNNPAGWAGGAVPSNKVVTVKGAGVAATTTDLPPFAGITVMDGASLTIANGGALPAVTLSDSASLTIASGTVTLGGTLLAQPSGNSIPALTIASGATLNVPGGTVFTDCSLSVSGTLAATTTGDITLGYAAAGATASFGLAINGGTISTTSGNVNFFCPASGGTVSPLGAITIRNATFTHTNDYGFNFGVNNPTATAIAITFDNTTLNYPKRGYYTIAGGSALRFVNGAALWRDNNQNDKFTLTVSGLASIFLGEGTSSLIGESSNSSSSVGNGFMKFSPDTDGFAALVISNATWETYHSAGNGKAVAQIYGASVHTINQNNYNRVQPFDGFKAVNLNAGATLTITNNVDVSSMNFTEKFTGSGSLLFSTPRSTTRTFNFNSTTSTATGTLSADPAKNDALVIASTATWGGTVAWNGKASINHGNTADAMTFGGIDLASDFTLRIWGDGTCDHYTLTGAGFIDNGGAIIVNAADGSEPAAGDEWTFARVPASSYVPSASSATWTIATRAVDGDDSVVDLVLSVAAGTDYTFDSTTVSDLSDPTGWANGSVPTGESVKISGAGVTAIVSDASTFPTFSAIAVRNGASLQILDNVTLPPLTIDSTSKVVFGDDATTVAATLDATFLGLADTAASPVALPIIEVRTNATLTVASGMKFKNVDFRLYGTVTKNGTDTQAPTFGYADNGETSYIAFTAAGGTFDFHANNNNGDYGAVFLVCPSSGGTVIPVGTITLRNAVRNVTGWADFGNWEFGVNNPTNVPFNVLVDGTAIDCSAYFYASGAAHLSLVNGSYIRRNSSCLGHWFPMAIQYSATITVGNGCYIDFTTNDGSFGIDSQMAVDTVTVRDGGAYTISQNSPGWQRGVFVSYDGVLGVPKLASRARTDLLLGFSSARLDGDLTIKSLNIGTGNTDWDRHALLATNVTFTGTGDVVVTNGAPAYPFTVTFRNGASTATGSIRVAKVDGDAETALYFADGANWAGTVVAGNVALTNLTDGAAAASATFNTLNLAADFPIRFWKTNGTVTSDTIKVDSFTGSAKLAFVAMDEELSPGDSFTVGQIKSGAALPKIARSFTISEGDPDANGYCDLRVRYSRGMQIIFK